MNGHMSQTLSEELNASRIGASIFTKRHINIIHTEENACLEKANMQILIGTLSI